MQNGDWYFLQKRFVLSSVSATNIDILKLSQGDVARGLNLQRSYFSGIERGVHNPSLRVVKKIAKALAVKPTSL